MKHRAYALVAVSLVLSWWLAGCSDDDPCPTYPEYEVEVATRTITSDQFIRNRFFRLHTGLETPGLDTGVHGIDPASIHVFRRLSSGPFAPGDISYVAVYPDSNGNWSGIDFQEPYDYGARWQELPFELLLDPDGRIRALDLGATPILDIDLIGVTYTVTDRTGMVVYRVGDNPLAVPPVREISADPGRLYYGVKLLKAPLDRAEPVSFAYEVRNAYDLGIRNIYREGTTLWIESWSLGLPDPAVDEQEMSYLRIFGLDRESADGRLGADGVWDFHRVDIFDLRRGLLFFPEDFPYPFAGSSDQYAAYVNDPAWEWGQSSYLAGHPAPELYSPLTRPDDLPYYGWFKIVVETRLPVDR